MIDLHYPIEAMLADIGVLSAPAAVPLVDLAAPAFLTAASVRVHLVGHSAADPAFLALHGALKARFAHLSPDRLRAELLEPLQRGLGNADKWGNRGDAQKAISIEAIVTNQGIVLSIQDQGAGFAVATVIKQQGSGEQYFHNKGKGFSQFAAVASLISFADEGRTFRLRFLCFPPERDVSGVGLAGDAAYMQTRLAEISLPDLPADLQLAACHLYQPQNKDDDDGELHYLLTYQTPAGTPIYQTLTGRHQAAGAAHDYTVTTQLWESGFNRRSPIHVPQPVAYLEDLQLVLYAFCPECNLRKQLTRISKQAAFLTVLQQVGRGLRALHSSAVYLPATSQPTAIAHEHEAALAALACHLQQVAPQQVEQVQHLAQTIQHDIEQGQPYTAVLTHGLLSWINLRYAGDRCYFYRFDRCQMAHPGYDLGHLLADLRRFCFLRNRTDAGGYALGRQALLDAYFGREWPAWHVDLPYFTAWAMLYRLVRLHENAANHRYAQLTAYLRQCEAAQREAAIH